MLWRRQRRRYTSRMEQEDKLKIQAKINELNSRESPAQRAWVAVDGFHAITAFMFGQGTQLPVFNSTQGYPLKVFVNNLTGEVKMFSAYLFRI